ncbi:MAG: murein biosynthesis integral membrane protein MurJ [Lachnospiraceae bacterium]|nr:murein biosynthesis integral membrane protein MurJ [Lachnospiraceae bacterium]
MATKRKSLNNIAKSAVMLSALTVFIKAIGFIKQAVISYYFGASAAMDSYLVVTDFVSEVGMMFFSSIAISLIAIYDEERKNVESKNVFVSNAFTGLIVFSIVLVVLACLFASPILRILAPGFSQEVLEESVRKLRIVSFLLINICISNICIALLNAEKRFIAAKSIGLIQSASIIIACIFFEKKIGIVALYYGFGAFYIVENIFLLFHVRKIFIYRLHNPFKDLRVRKLIKLSIPLFVSSAIVQINAMIDKAIASNLEAGSVSGMSYGNFVFSTIHSIMIASVTTVLYSYFSNYVVEKDEEAIVQRTKSSLHLLISLLIPICVCCCINSDEIIRLIYARGTFGEEAIRITGSAFLGYSAGIVFIAIRDVYLQVLYAYQKTKTALINGGAGVFINVVMSLVLSRYIGVFGIAIADSISYMVLVVMSYRSVCRILPGLRTVFIKRDYVIIGISTAVTFACGFILNIVIEDMHFFLRLVVSGLVIFGVYCVLMILFQYEPASYLKGFIMRNGQKKE